MRVHWLRPASGSLLAAGLLTGAPIAGQDAGPTAALLLRAGRYVGDYEQKFTAIVAEERRMERQAKPPASPRRSAPTSRTCCSSESATAPGSS